MGNENMEVSINGRNMLHICVSMIEIMGYYFRFSSIFIKKKSNQTGFFKKNKTEPEPVQTDRFQFIILEQKQVQTGLAGFSGLARFFFFSLARFFSGLARFFFGSVFSVSYL